jgi:hypothetical protein
MTTPAPGAGAGSGNMRDLFGTALFRGGRWPWPKWVADHNPCLLLSTVFMLLGCCLANWALREKSDTLQILALLGVINAYEACIIALGLVMIRRSRGAARDGWWLVLFEALFLVNAALINSKFGPVWMIPLETGLWVLACVKAAILFRGLKIGLGMRTFGFLALQLGIIYALPVVFAFAVKDTLILDRVMYGFLWVVGLLPVIYDVVTRVWWRQEPWDRVRNVVRWVYVIVPWAVLVLHLVFWRVTLCYRLSLADLGPVLLGLAAVSRRFNLEPNWRWTARLVPAMAFFMTLALRGEDVQWVFRIGEATKEVTAVHIMLAGTILTYGYMGTLWHLMAAGGTVMALGLGYLFMAWITQGVREGARTVVGIVPTTVYGWSVTTIGAAFVLLGIGGYLGLRRIGKEAGQGDPDVLG